MLKLLSNNLAFINLFLGILGYPLIVLIGTGIGVEESQIVTIPFRYAYLLFSMIYLSFNVFYLYKQRQFNINLFLFNFFWILYILRIIYDVYFRDIEANQFANSNVILGFALGVSFLPAFNSQFVTIKGVERFYSILFPLLLIISVLSIPFAISSLQENMRAVGGVGFGAISYGHYGASLVIISLYRFLKNKFVGKLMSISGVIVGFVIMGLSASKSPFAALLVVLVFYLLSRFSIKRFLAIGILTTIAILSLQAYISFMIEKGSGFLLRFQRFVESGDALRFQLYEEAIKEFLNHPIIGNQFVLENGIGAGIYPHNIFLESLMALGFIGGILILILLFNSLKICYYSIKELDNYSWIRLLFIQYFIFSMMSGGIYNSPLLWIFMALNFAVDKLDKPVIVENIPAQSIKIQPPNETSV